MAVWALSACVLVSTIRVFWHLEKTRSAQDKQFQAVLTVLERFLEKAQNPAAAQAHSYERLMGGPKPPQELNQMSLGDMIGDIDPGADDFREEMEKPV